MDSGVLELKEALDILFDKKKAEAGEQDKHAARLAREIADRFGNSNAALYDGWRTAENFCVRVTEAVNKLLEDVYFEIDRYVEKSYKAEKDAHQAVEAANQSANDILSRLGI